MKVLSRNLIPIILFILLSLNICISQSNKELVEQLDLLGDSIIEYTKVPGMIVGVWDYSKNLNYICTKGYADIENEIDMKSNMRFRIGNNTITFVITVLLQLVDEGKLTLEDKLSKYFPDIKDSDSITVRMICNMTSGIFNYTESGEFEMAVITNPEKVWKPDELIDISKKHEHYFSPGSGFHYSNTNTIIAGRIIEMLTGNKLETEIEDRIIKKLNLPNTYFASGKEITGSFCRGYGAIGINRTKLPDFTDKFDISWIWAAGAIISNLEDMKTYIESLVKGNLTDTKTHNERRKYISIPNHPGKYGLGIFSFNGFTGYCGGLIPGYSSLMAHNPEHNSTVIIIYNAQIKETKPYDLFFRVRKILGY